MTADDDEASPCLGPARPQQAPFGAVATPFGGAALGGGADPGLPVMLFIHGGSYVTGASNDYHGDALVAASNGTIVAVTVNYRLNVFGFLGGKALQARARDGSAGNFGLQARLRSE